MAEICVIVPVYNVKPYLRRCVDSLLAQTYSDHCIVLIDDGSTDGCDEICDEYAASDSRIYVIHQKNGGLSAARNAGIDWAFAHSDFKWICFIDSDDWVHPLFLEMLLKAVKENSTEISVSSYFMTTGKDFSDEEEISIRKCKTKDLYENNTVNATVAWGKLYKKECFKNIRFPVGKIHEDEYVTYQVIFQHEYICYIEQPLYAYYQNDNGIMRSSWNSRRLDCFDALEGQVDFFVDNGYMDIAQMRFKTITDKCLYFPPIIEDSDTLPEIEKKKCIQIIKKRLRAVLLKYRKYKWVSIWRRGDDLWIYANAYPSLMLVLRIWKPIKAFLKKSFAIEKTAKNMGNRRGSHK